MDDDKIVSVSSIGKILASFVTSGGVSSIAGVVDKGLELILRLTADDPIKRQKALREYQLELEKIIKEIPNVKNKDVTDLAVAFTRLMDGK